MSCIMSSETSIISTVTTTPAEPQEASLVSYPATAAFPVIMAGRLPHCTFRGLLGVHCALRPARPADSLTEPFLGVLQPICHLLDRPKCFRLGRASPVGICTRGFNVPLQGTHNNVSERTLRHQAIGRKNWLFLGSEAAGPRAAVLCTILAGVKRHRLEPWCDVRELLLRLHADDPRLDEMLPDRWAAAHPQAVLSHRLDESRAKAARTRARRAHRRARCR